MRRWTGTRWVEYAPGESQPDEAPLLDFERLPKTEAQVAPGWPITHELDCAHLLTGAACSCPVGNL